MYREIEAKILDIDPGVVERRIQELGGVLKREVDLEQVIWWVPNSKKGESMRVRRASNGFITITLKEKVENGSGYNEWESPIENYEIVVEIIDHLIPAPDLRLEFFHHRKDWDLDGAEININWFPKIKPLLEIETSSEEHLGKTAEKLGFGREQLVDRGIISLLFEELKLKIGDKIKI
ncbi:CYTH domain-containing protein [Patescibacteria group bacterium]|nr:CYTH domain-containing protein [Patescibacteria group bacterium]